MPTDLKNAPSRIFTMYVYLSDPAAHRRNAAASLLT